MRTGRRESLQENGATNMRNRWVESWVKSWAKSRVTAGAGLVVLLSMTLPGAGVHLPRTLEGKPDFSGVWAGPAFSHKVGPGDTDTPVITRYNPKTYAD